MADLDNLDISNIHHEVFIEGQNNVINNYNNNLGYYNNNNFINYNNFINNNNYNNFINNNNYNNNNNNNNNNNKIINKPSNIIEEAFIDKLVKEENKDIGFDLSLLKRNKLYVNLIHFDSKITNKENYDYYCKFKVDVVGGYHAIDDLEILKKYLKGIENKNIPFIVISSGSDGENVIKICKKYSFIKEIIIFCGNLEYNKHYLKEYPGYVKKVLNRIKKIYEYIKSFGENYKVGIKKYKKLNHFIFPSEFIEMDRQLEQCPVISAYEYDNCYFLIHRAYAHFFGDINNKNSKAKFTSSNYDVIEEYIENIKLEEVEKNDLKNKFRELKDQDNFVELAIRKYTEESNFSYFFNRTMRNFDEGLISYAYFMGPFLYGLNKYVKENPIPYGFREDMTLYRYIKCSKLDFYLYKINLNHIICFPSITSTTIHKDKVFHPTKNAQKINNIIPSKDDNSQKTNNIIPSKDDIVNVKMIFNYKHRPDIISRGIIIRDFKGKDGEYLSSNNSEEEVILFPFTFVRINKIEPDLNDNNTFIMYLDIVNRIGYIENILKNKVEKRFLFSDLDKKINKIK